MKKRLIASVFIFNDKCYQTISYNNYRPLGDIKNILQILDRHQVDEIFILDRNKNKGLNLIILEKIRTSKVFTPIIYSGAIKTCQDVKEILKYGVDRIAINSSLWDEKKTLDIIGAIGKQGVIGVLPFKIINNEIFFFYSQDRIFKKLDSIFLDFIRNLKIEILLIDTLADGFLKGFNIKILNYFNSSQLILQGGVLSEIQKFNKKNIVGIAVENRLLWKEHYAINLRSKNNFFINKNINL